MQAAFESKSFDGFEPAKAREMMKSGQRELALEYVHKFAEQGNTRAMIALADFEFDDGNLDASLFWVNKVEEAVKAGDMESCIYLASAYERGLGDGRTEDRLTKSISLLEQAAEVGNLPCMHALMTNYLYGLNGTVASKERFKYWAEKAASSGSSSARQALSRIDDWPNI